LALALALLAGRLRGVLVRGRVTDLLLDLLAKLGVRRLLLRGVRRRGQEAAATRRAGGELLARALRELVDVAHRLLLLPGEEAVFAREEAVQVLVEGLVLDVVAVAASERALG